MAGHCNISKYKLGADPKNPSATIECIVTGTMDISEVNALTLATVPSYVDIEVPITYSTTATGSIPRLAVDVEEQGGGVWKTTVRYGLDAATAPSWEPSPPPPPGVPLPPPPPPAPSQLAGSTYLGPEFTFSTRGGTAHITQSRQTKAKNLIQPAGVVVADGAPDLQGAIGVSRDRVEGCDVIVGKMEWSITVKARQVTHDYIKTLESYTPCLNSTTFFARQAEEVLFVGVDGNYQPAEGWTLQYHFISGKTITNYALAGCDTALSNVKPFDHIWVTYKDAVVSGYPIQLPWHVYQERVYPVADLSTVLDI